MSAVGHQQRRPMGPEWDFVVILETFEKGDPRVECLFCKRTFWAGASRIRAHLISKQSGLGITPCKAEVPLEVAQRFKELEDKRAREELQKKRRVQLEKVTKGSGTSCLSQSIVGSCFQRASKLDVDQAVARAFYANGISFNVARSSYWKDAVRAIACAGPTYQPPSFDALRTTLLDSERAQLDRKMKELYLDEISRVGCTITSDGWSNTNNAPLLNTLLVTPKGEWFLSASDTSGHVKSAVYIAAKILKSVEMVGVENVVQIITDNASNCKSAGKNIEILHPHITWSGCVAHAMDLCLQDIGKFVWASSVLKESRKIVKFIYNHHMSLAIFRTKSMLELLKPAETRFAHIFIVLERLLRVRLDLEGTVTCQAWRDWAHPVPAIRSQAECMKEKVLSGGFWKEVEEIVALCAPILTVLRLADSPMPGCGKFYGAFQHAFQCITDLQLAGGFSEKKEAVLEAMHNRFEFIVSDLHYAGYILDPEFLHHSQGEQAEVMEAYLRVIDKLLPEPVQRVQCLAEMGVYKNGGGIFSSEVVKLAAKEMPGYQWWKEFGATCPLMQKIAVKILSQPISACSCERNWSSFEFIHSNKRNRLGVEKATSLVSVFNNLRLHQKITDVDYREEFPRWLEEDVL